ncbi:MAG: hypothetical protein ABI855_03160 [Bacteroidota bacterium]
MLRKRRWTMDDGRWTMDDGRLPMDDCQWTKNNKNDDRLWSLVYGLWSITNN